MRYAPTHVMMQSKDLDPQDFNYHDDTLRFVPLDVILPVLETIIKDGKLIVRVNTVDEPENDWGWWLGFESSSTDGDTYGYATDMSLPHLRDD